MAAYRKAIDLKPDYAEAYANLGNAFHDQKKFEESETAFRKARRIIGSAIASPVP